MSSVRKHFSLEAANFSLFSQEGEVTSPLIPGPAWSLRLQFTKYQQRYAPMIFFYFHLRFISGALNYTGASFCATSFYLPLAYISSLGGALVLLTVLRQSWCCSYSLWLFVALWFPHCFLLLFFYMCCDASIVVTVFNSCTLCFLIY